MNTRITTLPSDLRIVTDAIPHLRTTSLGLWVGVGSRHETEAEHGLSHFLEHMAFKGTRSLSQLAGKQWAKFADPASDSFVGQVEAALGQHLLDVSQAQREP